MTHRDRSQVLRRARLATAGIVIAAVGGTAGLTAVTAAASTAGHASDNNHDDLAPRTGTGSFDDGSSVEPGLLQAPPGQPQGGSNAS